MPELPEVETVRRGLAEVLVGRRITGVAVAHPRAVRRNPGGAAAVESGLRGALVAGTGRRGKYLWLSLEGAGADLAVAHLGMSGQFRVSAAHSLPPPGAAYSAHERVRMQLDDGRVLSFVDQRTFGWIDTGGWAAPGLPAAVEHVAADPLEPAFDPGRVIPAARRRHSAVKRALLDQTLVDHLFFFTFGSVQPVETAGRVIDHTAHTIYIGLHVQQHSPNVGMIDDSN